MSSSRTHLDGALRLLAIAVVIELLLLRTATRTLIHIPGLSRFETPIAVLAEVGRFAYYLAAVSLVVTLVLLTLGSLDGENRRPVAAGVVTLTFLVVAAAGRIGVLPWATVGWFTLGLLAAVGLATWRGMRSLPVSLFLLGSVSAGASVLAQGVGGGLTGVQMDLLVWVAEWCVVLGGLTSPLLLKKAPRGVALAVGAASAIVVAGAFYSGASTLSILVMWNVGVPGWLPGAAYALALSGVVATLWSAAVHGQSNVTIGVLLLVAGGVGMISTYQTSLVLAAVLILGEPGDGLIQADRVDAAQNEPSRPDAVPVGVS